MIQLLASYRLQLTPDGGFDMARRQLDRLHLLGISHAYLSPVTEAVPGSTHGYDVVDHTSVREELGGLEGLTALLDALDERGMAAIVDHVPNHVSVAAAELNPRWWELLRDGPDAPAARWFDVDWEAGSGRVLLPVLGQPLEEMIDAFAVRDGELRVGDLRLPLAAGTEAMEVPALLAAQHYDLIQWRRPERNVRRFFTIDSLVAVRVEHAEVTTAVDTVPRLLLDHPGFGGVRVDHVDGLADPGGYLRQLRELLGDRWIVVEKILAPGETLPEDWPVDGTTGYEHARVLEHALLDRQGWSTIAARWAQICGDGRPFRAWELEARREVLDGALAPDRDRVARVASAAVSDLDLADARAAVTELSAHLRRYRTYLPHDEAGGAAMESARLEATAARPDLAGPLDRLTRAMATADRGVAAELRTRWQQLTGPATAKGVEDRAFWRYLALASLGEVGGEVEPASDPIPLLHEHHAATASQWPTTMLAGTTHDVARSEDVRAIGLMLASAAKPWSRVVDERVETPTFPDLDLSTRWLALQTVATTPGLSTDRLAAFLVKAAREADQRTSWVDPDEAYEQRLVALAQDVLVWPPVAELAASLDRPGRATALAMLAVRVTAPGVPDVYQGTEAFTFLLVDPDNRLPPDQQELEVLVAGVDSLDAAAAWAEPNCPAAKAVVLHRLLALRRRLPDVFGPGGGYLPLHVKEDVNVIAFARTDQSGAARVVTVVAPPGVMPARPLPLPPGRWRHVLVDNELGVEGELDLGGALGVFPAVVLVRD